MSRAVVSPVDWPRLAKCRPNASRENGWRQDAAGLKNHRSLRRRHDEDRDVHVVMIRSKCL